MPTRFIASRSAVMPSREMFPSSGNQYTQGLAESGGLRNPEAMSSPPSWADMAEETMAPNHMPPASRMICRCFIRPPFALVLGTGPGTTP